MDGLSAAASVIAVAQLAGLCLKLSEKWLGPSEFSSSDLTTIKTTLHGFFEAINKFKGRLRAHEDNESREGSLECLPQVLERCKQALDMVQSFMSNRGLIGKHIVAPRFDAKLKASLKALEAARELFMFALHVDNQAILLKTQQFLQSFADTSSTTLKRIHDNLEERGRESKKFRQDTTAFQSNATDSLARLEENVSKMASSLPVQATATLSSLPEEQKQKILESLKFDQIDARQVSIRNAHAKTCKWVLNNLKYNDWLDSGKLTEHFGFIWIRGKPGAGKSTLMKFLLVQAKKTMKRTTIISFFFHARGGDLEKSTVGMYRSLLFQLLTQRPELQDYLVHIVGRTFYSDRYEWGIEPLKAVTQEVICYLSQSSLVLFIDALDECDEDEIRDMISFFVSLGELTTALMIPFRVCFSSRYYPEIQLTKGLDLHLDREKGHARDIITYVESELKIGKSSLAQKVRRKLRRKARGVFMWAVLVVGILNKEYDHGNVPELWNRLQDIPDDLHELFRRILTRDNERKDRLLLCIQWVLFSRAPLKPEQLCFAVFSGTQPDILCQYDPADFEAEDIQRFITSSSKGLIEITDKSFNPTVQFIHESVKDFLLKSNGLHDLWPDLGSEFEVKSHDRLKDCCLNQLRIDVTDTLGIDKPLPTASSRDGKMLRRLTNKTFAFLECAVNGVLYHADLAEAGGISQSRFLQDFELTSWVMLNNLFVQYENRRHPKTVSLLYILAELNCGSLIGACPMKQSCFDEEGSQYGLPLYAAFATLSKEAVSALLKAEAQSQPDNVLLQNLARKYSTWEGNCMAIRREFNFVRDKHEGALSFAAKSGDTEMLAFLLGSGELDIASTYDGNPPLAWAARGGHSTAVELLIEMGAEINRMGFQNWTPLHGAAAGGHDETVRILLAKGANLEAKDSRDRTPLMLASQNGREKVIRILLELGANIEARGEKGCTPLRDACVHGSESAVRALLEKGARTDTKDADDGTPLMAASKRENKRIAEMLLEKGTDIEAKDKEGRTALICASASNIGRGNTVKILLEYGANIHATDQLGRTPLSWASSAYGRDSVVRMLLERGADIEAKDSNGITSLVHASQWGREAVVMVLLENGARIDTRDLSQYMPFEGKPDGAYQLILKEAEKQTIGIEDSEAEEKTFAIRDSKTEKEIIVIEDSESEEKTFVIRDSGTEKHIIVIEDSEEEY